MAYAKIGADMIHHILHLITPSTDLYNHSRWCVPWLISFTLDAFSVLCVVNHYRYHHHHGRHNHNHVQNHHHHRHHHHSHLRQFYDHYHPHHCENDADHYDRVDPTLAKLPLMVFIQAKFPHIQYDMSRNIKTNSNI